MSGDTTYQALKRLSFLRERADNDNGSVIAGQPYDDVWIIGGEIQNTLLKDCTFDPPISGSGITSQQIVSSGSTATAILGQAVLMNSASGLAKTVTAPTATGSLQIISIIDVRGDAGTSNITFTPLTGSVVGNSVGQNQVYTNYGTGTWLDTSQGWARVG